MKIKLLGRRIAGNDPVTFRNPKGDAIILDNVGDESQDLEPDHAYHLCALYPDILAVVKESAKSPKAKWATPELEF